MLMYTPVYDDRNFKLPGDSLQITDGTGTVFSDSVAVIQSMPQSASTFSLTELTENFIISFMISAHIIIFIIAPSWSA